MGRGQNKYTKEFKDTMVGLYNSGKSITDLSSEYGISKSTIQGWINKAKPVVISDDKTLTTDDYIQMQKEMARLREENEILKKPWEYSQRNKLSI